MSEQKQEIKAGDEVWVKAVLINDVCTEWRVQMKNHESQDVDASYAAYVRKQDVIKRESVAPGEGK